MQAPEGWGAEPPPGSTAELCAKGIGEPVFLWGPCSFIRGERGVSGEGIKKKKVPCLKGPSKGRVHLAASAVVLRERIKKNLAPPHPPPPIDTLRKGEGWVGRVLH